MALELIAAKGLPASGKSTWAAAWVAEKPGLRVRVNKDTLREMLHDGAWSKAREKQVVVARDVLVNGFLSAGISVVVDDTNFAPVHEQTLREIAKTNNATFTVNSTFTSVPIEECIKRDLKRTRSVGESVIRDMHKKYLAPKPADPPALIDGAPWVWLVDLDGTLAHMNGRKPFEWSRVGEDVPDPVVVKLVQDIINSGDQIVFMSGRDAVCKQETREWLAVHVGEESRAYALYMRPEGDTRKDSIVKRELFDAQIAGRYNVRAVLDDRNQVVRMWRDELGLKVLQVADGDF